MKLVKNIVAFFKKEPDLFSRIFLVLGVVAILALAIFLSGPGPKRNNPAIPTPTPAAIQVEVSPTLSYDPFSEYASTTGVTVATIGLVIILLGGTFIELLSNKKGKKN
jgi:hypothetical protein